MWNGNNFNPYMMPGMMPMGQAPNIDNLYAQYKNMQAQMNVQPSVNVNPAMGQRGTWVQIHEYKEVENSPVPTDGTPMLFFDYEHGVFYSKKFANGQCCIQDFYFGPTNGSNNSNKEEAMPEPQVNSDMNPLFSALFDKLDELSKQIGALAKKPNSKAKLPAEGE